MSRRSARLTRRGIRAHVRRRGKLVGVEATASCWEYVARGGILAFGIVAVAILAVAMVMMGSTDAAIAKTESSLTSWEGPGCSGQTATVESCGATSSSTADFQGETATFYTETGCAGTPYQVIGGFEGTQFCGDFGWRSINIDC
ncbi:LOW QUALITY PROTEIN: hypothetical protein SETIT_7G211500v2 [Setaria italica]|uniref:Uncharacterized protein n=1 Tax=Setaria italica TaxID=4555 RepID=A0A368RY50_SETIT|nr:LOW QUALITY PROTEIN: hypothetical protein SETIT_7G211500v2 [Setaria italica]